MKRSWIKRGTKPMRRVSKRRAAHQRDPARKAEYDFVAERSGGQCERMLDRWGLNGEWVRLRCGFAAVQMHHILPRSRGGKDHRENLLYLCMDCHAFTLNFPSQSVVEGILK